MSRKGFYFQSVWGIQTGDMVTTSYGTGPYEVLKIRGPVWWEDVKHQGLLLYAEPYIHLTLCNKGKGRVVRHVNTENGYAWLNHVPRGDIVLLTDGNWPVCRLDQRPAIEHTAIPSYLRKVYVQANSDPSMVIINTLFPPMDGPEAWSVPYERRAGVDYLMHVWHCTTHGDFNADPVTPQASVARCPYGDPHSWCEVYPIIDQVARLQGLQHTPAVAVGRDLVRAGDG